MQGSYQILTGRRTTEPASSRLRSLFRHMATQRARRKRRALRFPRSRISLTRSPGYWPQSPTEELWHGNMLFLTHRRPSYSLR